MRDGIINLGEAPETWGFTKENFSEDSYLWFREEEKSVVISLIVSKNPGAGAFSRLVKAIEADGFVVIVPNPLGDMRAILKKWGFGSGFLMDHKYGAVEIWTRNAKS